jgi:hypothetical protein
LDVFATRSQLAASSGGGSFRTGKGCIATRIERFELREVRAFALLGQCRLREVRFFVPEYDHRTTPCSDDGLGQCCRCRKCFQQEQPCVAMTIKSVSISFAASTSHARNTAPRGTSTVLPTSWARLISPDDRVLFRRVGFVRLSSRSGQRSGRPLTAVFSITVAM